MVNEPRVFEPLKFSCIFWGHIESSGMLGLITMSFPVFWSSVVAQGYRYRLLSSFICNESFNKIVCLFQLCLLMSPPSQDTKPYQAHYLSVCCVLHVSRFDKADATADVQWHCPHLPPLRHHLFQLRAHWVRISWSIGSEKLFGLMPPVGVEPSTSCVNGEHSIY